MVRLPAPGFEPHFGLLSLSFLSKLTFLLYKHGFKVYFMSELHFLKLYVRNAILFDAERPLHGTGLTAFSCGIEAITLRLLN